MLNPFGVKTQARGSPAELLIGTCIHCREYCHWLITGENESPAGISETHPEISNMPDILKDMGRKITYR